MLGVLARRLFGSANDRLVKSMRKTVDQINALEPPIAALYDQALRAKTDEFQQRLAAGETLDDLLVEAFAVVREAAKRTLRQRHFDVQLIGGMVLHKGGIAEMKTGEGKTLVATLAAYLNALEGKGVHVVTVNDYLARRDAGWMGAIYRLLGMSVGVIVPGPGRRAAARRPMPATSPTAPTTSSASTICATTCATRWPSMVQRGAPLRHRRRGRFDPGRRGAHAADHQRPDRRQLRALPGDRQADAPSCVPGDWEKDEKQRSVSLTEQGQEHMHGLLDAGRPAQGARPLRHRERLAGAPRPAGAARAQGVRPRRRLHRQGRQGHHHRRVHRPDDGRPALLGRAASGARGQGGGADPGREPDPGLDHLPELLPPLQEARRHDRHGRDRGRRVRRDLPAGRDRDPDPPRDGPQGRGRRGLPHARARRTTAIIEEVPVARTPRASRSWSARSRSRSPSMLSEPAQGQGPAAPGAQRPLPRAGGATSSPRPGGWAR